MLILIDRGTGLRAINTAQYEDRRHYYLLERSLVVCRNGLTLAEVQGLVVDATIGTDIAQSGFASEAVLSKPRTKITIYRVVRDKLADTRLSAILARQI